MSDFEFAMVAARAEAAAAAPTLVLTIRITTTPPVSVHTGIVRCQLQIDPRRRRYSPAEAELLLDLFGEPTRWNDTMRPVLWAQVPLVVPRFDGTVDVELPIPCTYDFGLASSKYFQALEDGEVPILCQFSGTIFLAAPQGFQIAQVPWDKEASFRLPASMWREAMDQHFPDTAWIRLSRDSFDALSRFRMRQGLPSWEEAIDRLCAEAEAREPV
ncbi:MAG: DUF6084 family protein [Acidobacteriota bacterium]